MFGKRQYDALSEYLSSKRFYMMIIGTIEPE